TQCNPAAAAELVVLPRISPIAGTQSRKACLALGIHLDFRELRPQQNDVGEEAAWLVLRAASSCRYPAPVRWPPSRAASPAFWPPGKRPRTPRPRACIG